MKLCKACNTEKSFVEFHKNKLGKLGLATSCKKCVILRTKKWKLENRDKDRENKKVSFKNFYEKNKKREIARSANYLISRRKTDVGFKLRGDLRARLNGILQGKNKAGSAVRDLGCSIEDLLKHLEAQFQPEMTWENHGKYGWHIDHKIPLSKFDLTDREQFLKACHFTNLQPLWAIDNLKKGNRCG